MLHTRLSVVFVLGGLLLASAAQAQPPQLKSPSGTGTKANTAGLLAQAIQQGRFQLNLRGGRLRLADPAAGALNNPFTSTSALTPGALRERLNYAPNEGRPTLNYEATDDQERFSVEVRYGTQIVVRRVPKAADRPPVELEQAADDVTLTVGRRPALQVYHATNLWQLLVIHPEACRDHLSALLQRVRPELNLAGRLPAVEEELLRLASTEQTPDRQRWTALVNQLGDDRYAKRESADRQLREAGPALLPFLERLDLTRLDAEQQFRMRRIAGLLMEELEDDTPDQAALWIASDPSVWLVLLSRPQESVRRLAAGQLSRLLGGPLAFDPGASEEMRKAQVEQLRSKLPPE